MREYKKSSYRGELTNAAIYMAVIFEGLAALAVVFCIYPWVMEGCSIKYALLGLASLLTPLILLWLIRLCTAKSAEEKVSRLEQEYRAVSLPISEENNMRNPVYFEQVMRRQLDLKKQNVEIVEFLMKAVMFICVIGLAFFKDKSSAMFWLMVSTFVFVVYHLKNRGKLFINEEIFSQMEVKQGMVIHQRFSYSKYRLRLQSHLTEKFYLTIRVGDEEKEMQCDRETFLRSFHEPEVLLVWVPQRAQKKLAGVYSIHGYDQANDD